MKPLLRMASGGNGEFLPHPNEDSMTGPALQQSEVPVAESIDYDMAVEQFYAALYKFAFVLTRSASDAADLTQETYRVLLLKGGQIREQQNMRCWLFTTLHRRFLRRCSHIRRFPEVPFEHINSELPSTQAKDGSDAAIAIRALQTLEEKFRAPLVLFYLQDRSYREIAALLGTPLGTIMSRLSRGKEQLRQALGVDRELMPL